MLIACVSDISVGYGTPQIISLLQSLQQRFESSEKPLVLEVNQPERPPRHEQYPQLQIERIYTKIHPHSGLHLGRVEYIRRAAEILNVRRPEVIVIPNSFCLPVLWNIDYRPQLIIYYVLEMPSTFTVNREEIYWNRRAAEIVDLAIYPEPNRARAHMEHYSFAKVPALVIYNTAASHCGNCMPIDQRNGRILYQGTIHPQHTAGTFYLEEDLQDLPIDLYGLLEGYDLEFKQRIGELSGNIRHMGYVDNAALGKLRPFYNFTIVYWTPSNPNQLYACPNKFFESLADGIPPITAPHPQTKTLVDRYACGLVMPDWSLEAFEATLRQAIGMIGTPAYAEMVENCVRAFNEELNWGTQFKKIDKMLDKIGMQKAGSGKPVWPQARPSARQPVSSGAT